jgi:hypothetical protein
MRIVHKVAGIDSRMRGTVQADIVGSDGEGVLGEAIMSARVV